MAISDEEPGAPQLAPMALADAFRSHDIAALERLTAAEREEQERARAKLLSHVDQMWDEVNPRRGGPGGPAASVIAGMRDIAIGLYSDARDAQRQAGDLDG
jgi:hypothetical protein